METCLRRSGRSYRLKDAPNHGVFQMNTPLVIFSYLIDFFWTTDFSRCCGFAWEIGKWGKEIFILSFA